MIYIIIPVHNRKEFTRQCLLSLRQQTYKQFKVVVIDDGSTDGTEEMLAKEFPEVHVIKGDGNLWWTAAMNLGVNYVLKISKDEDYILTLNNDLYVKNDYLENIINAIKNKPGSLIGSISVDAEEQSKILDAGVKINWITAKYHNLSENMKEMKEIDEYLRVDALPGRGTLIPVEVFRKVGIFNHKLLPHYGADYEFSIRAKKRGYKLFVHHKLIVYSFSKETGLNNSIKKLKWSEWIKSYVAIKSPNNLKYRWNFAKLFLPKVYVVPFFILDSMRVFFGGFKNQIASMK